MSHHWMFFSQTVTYMRQLDTISSMSLSYVTWTFNMGRPFWFMDAYVSGCTTCHQIVTDSACIYTDTNPKVFISHIIAPRHDR